MTNAAATARVMRRRTRVYWTCHVLRWLPFGLVVPVFALVPAQRGLSIAEVGVVFGVYTATAAILELPTGSLADIVGRRPVLILAALLETACFAGFLVADKAFHFCVAMTLGGIGRALNSGALEAWYVDGAYAEMPGADVRPAIGTAMFLSNAAALVGALTVAALPLMPGLSWAGEPAVLAFYGAVPCGVLQIAAVVLLIREPRRERGTGVLLRALRGIPAFAWQSARLSVRLRSLRLLLLAGLGVGVGMGAAETFWQPEFARRIGDPVHATSFLGMLVVAATVAGGVGSLLAARMPSRVVRRKDLLCAGLLVLIGLAIAGMAMAPSVGIAALCFVGTYFFLELRAPLAQTLLHQACPSGRRASVLSAYSMSTNAGAVVGSLVLGTLLGRLGASMIWLVAAAAVAVAGVAYLRLRSPQGQLGADHLQQAAEPVGSGAVPEPVAGQRVESDPAVAGGQ